ncbi:DNA-3-methyladenine glycosylase I [Alteromonas sp. ASW11-130]|uniref:DNA-3-methyladenine glycosylase I n=1 Tax=Alteromonas sp. ASW11-130 TaxID=3015775 RepID=UPI002241E1C7|nr:DNA-3-methyladenine glycosylase I [Alteromonas sp. ASW11-130]MCW8093446.1 DNA-3-methyladenine glycosylase I [Alteromonas sp. ASW11-130]
MADPELKRCGWVSDDPLYQQYHDQVWGRPELDDEALFAKLCLDGQQAGLSWITILRKQKSYEEAFCQFNAEKILKMPDAERDKLIENPGIIRNKLKINSIFKNAEAYLKIKEQESFKDFIWQFTNGKTVINEWRDQKQVPVSTDSSRQMAKTLKKAGFTFVGETICYAFMQAVGMVNDHTIDCHCYEKVCEEAIT